MLFNYLQSLLKCVAFHLQLSCLAVTLSWIWQIPPSRCWHDWTTTGLPAGPDSLCAWWGMVENAIPLQWASSERQNQNGSQPCLRLYAPTFSRSTSPALVHLEVGGGPRGRDEKETNSARILNGPRSRSSPRAFRQDPGLGQCLDFDPWDSMQRTKSSTPELLTCGNCKLLDGYYFKVPRLW